MTFHGIHIIGITYPFLRKRYLYQKPSSEVETWQQMQWKRIRKHLYVGDEERPLMTNLVDHNLVVQTMDILILLTEAL